MYVSAGIEVRGGRGTMTPVMDVAPPPLREPLQDYFRPPRNASVPRHDLASASQPRPRRRSHQEEPTSYLIRAGRLGEPPRRTQSAVALRPPEFLRARDFRETLSPCGRDGRDVEGWAWEPRTVREALQGPNVPFRFCPTLAACHIPRASVRVSRKQHRYAGGGGEKEGTGVLLWVMFIPIMAYMLLSLLLL